MKNVFLISLCFISFSIFYGQTAEIVPQQLTWLSFEEAMKAGEKNPKPVMIDVYTDWCGWCKRMDAATFNNPEIAVYLSEKFHVVKLDAEQKASIFVGEKEYKFVPGGRNGHHELAAELMGGKMSYPTIVFLDEKFNMIQPLAGYRGPEDMAPILHFFGSGDYKSKTWEVFFAEFSKKATQE